MLRVWGVLAATFLAWVGFPRDVPAAESPQWIWGDREARQFAAQDAFDLPTVPQRARLKSAVDFCTATVWLNEQAACEFHESERIESFDVARLLKQGRNQLRLSAESTGGPAAIAYELVIEQEDGTTTTIRSSAEPAAESRSESAVRQQFGSMSGEPWWDIQHRPNINVFDEYNQWSEAKSGSAEDEVAAFRIADGFEIELLCTAESGQGSWVSMAVDDRDRILLGREDAGILRLTFAAAGNDEPLIEELNTSLEGVQGLLLTAEGLFASANRSAGLYRLRSSSADGSFDEVKLLRETVGGGGDHGQHDVVQDGAGRLYVVLGDSIEVPAGSPSLVPITNEFSDRLPEAGHVIQTDVDGKTWNVFCSGLRNPYGLALNDAGELFTYDADAERHTGLPWYRPTRIVHLMPGVDYGWRSPEIPWPGYLPDSMPPIAAIGRGSPTSLKFGYRSHFPGPYRDALFALDWSYGRILAVHLVPRGASYSAHAEVFVRGRPFSVCDLDFTSDGSMLVITGGRDTQSRLYRIRYAGPDVVRPVDSQQMLARANYSRDMREQRRLLESLCGQRGSTIVDRGWNYLSHPDPAIRSAARILLEHQPTSTWQNRVWNEQRPEFALPALLALTRVGPPELFPRIHRKLQSLSLSGMRELEIAVRIESSLDKKLPRDANRSLAIRLAFDPCFPTRWREPDRELCQLLVAHDSEFVVEQTLSLIAAETNQIDKFHYLHCLAEAANGWDPGRHDEFFRLLSGARMFFTDEGLEDRVQGLFDKAIDHVPPARQTRYRAWFASSSADEHAPIASRPLITRWTVSEIMSQLPDTLHSADIDRGARVFEIATCSRCHRFGTTGRPFGPDLTTVASRFSRRHVVEQIVEPSRTIATQYRNYAVVLTGGKVLTGQITYNGFRKSILRIATDPTALDRSTEIRTSRR